MALLPLTVDEARRVFDYDADSGILSRRVSTGSRSRLGPTGCPVPTGYLMVRLHRKAHYVHRLAWLLTYGEWPVGEIDHINGDRSDNRLCNLRDLGRAENGQNIGVPANNTSGATGVYFSARAQRWVAEIKVNQKKRHIGTFVLLADAVAARQAARAAVHPYGAREQCRSSL
jgi:hypothetical protein